MTAARKQTTRFKYKHNSMCARTQPSTPRVQANGEKLNNNLTWACAVLRDPVSGAARW